MIELKHVTKTFDEGDRFEVIKDVSFTAHDGEFVCILGPSGCGKSILLSIVAGFLPPTSGTLTLRGQSITKPSTQCVMLFQQSMLFPWKTVLQNVFFGLCKTDLSDKEKWARAREQLRLVGLEAFADWYPHKLSGGMQQRVALARALVTDPDVLLMDEPFAALDSQYRHYLQNMIIDVWKRTKKTILFVTHSLPEALRLADTVYLFTARPAQIKSMYPIDMPRPRHPDSSTYRNIKDRIEEELRKEFEQTVNVGAQEQPVIPALIHF